MIDTCAIDQRFGTTITVAVSGDEVEASDAHTWCRPALYELLHRADPDAATAIYAQGWNGSGRRPWSVSPPSEGRMVIATPFEELGRMFIAGLRSTTHIAWGRYQLVIDDVTVDQRPHDAIPGHVVERWAATTPVIVQGPMARPKRVVLVPGDSGWEEGLHARFASMAMSIGARCHASRHSRGEPLRPSRNDPRYCMVRVIESARRKGWSEDVETILA